MKKLIAVICAVAMMLTLAMPAMANPSIAGVVVNGEGETEDGVRIIIIPSEPETYASSTVKELVATVNGDEVVMTPAELVEKLGVDNAPDDIDDYHFVTGFYDIVATDGSEITGPLTLNAILDVLVGADSLENYLIMQIDSTTGEMYFISLDQAKFDPETGSVTVTFPIVGPFSLIQK